MIKKERLKYYLMKMKKIYNSKKTKNWNIPINKIYFINSSKESLKADISISLNESYDELLEKIKDNNKEIVKIKWKELNKGCILESSMFDPEGFFKNEDLVLIVILKLMKLKVMVEVLN